MALLHHAELSPSKLELIAAWAPSQPWFAGEASADFVNAASYRFDDPLGQVGIETVLVRAGDGPLLQVPLTYRDAPLEGADDALITTMDHSVLGKRWAYDGAGDPAYLAAVITAALAGGHQADQYFEVDGVREMRQPTALVAGSGVDAAVAVTASAIGVPASSSHGAATVVETSDWSVAIARIVDGSLSAENAVAVITGTWTDQPTPTVLVAVTAR